MLHKLGPDGPLGLYADFTFLPIYHRMENVSRIKKKKQASNVAFYFLHSLQKTAEELMDPKLSVGNIFDISCEVYRKRPRRHVR